MEFDSISEQMVFLRSRGVMLNTLVHDKPVSVGLQSVLFVPTVVFLYEYEGTPVWVH